MAGLEGEKQRKRGDLCSLVLFFFFAKGKEGSLVAECERVRFVFAGKWPAIGQWGVFFFSQFFFHPFKLFLPVNKFSSPL